MNIFWRSGGGGGGGGIIMHFSLFMQNFRKTKEKFPKVLRVTGEFEIPLKHGVTIMIIPPAKRKGEYKTYPLGISLVGSNALVPGVAFRAALAGEVARGACGQDEGVVVHLLARHQRHEPVVDVNVNHASLLETAPEGRRKWNESLRCIT